MAMLLDVLKINIMFSIVIRTLFLLLAIFFIYRGYSIMFGDGTLYRDVFSNNQDVVNKSHNIYGAMFTVIGIMILVFLLKTFKKKT